MAVLDHDPALQDPWGELKANILFAPNKSEDGLSVGISRDITVVIGQWLYVLKVLLVGLTDHNCDCGPAQSTAAVAPSFTFFDFLV